MARVILGSYMVRYPLGGVLSSSLQWLTGFQRLGHEIFLVEKFGWENSCYDPVRNVSSNDCAHGAGILNELLSRFGLASQWCFVDAAGIYHGMSRSQVDEIFRTADVFIDRGTHGAWLDEAQHCRRVYIDGEPAFRQMSMENDLQAGKTLPQYDNYFTTGRNIGTQHSSSPLGGQVWHPLFHPVSVDLFSKASVPDGAPFSTVMNWQSHEPVVFDGVSYGQKDIEFEKYMDLPLRTKAPLEVAVAGRETPRDRLRQNGWRVCDAHQVTKSFDSYLEYVQASRGEFSICKQGYVASNCGWFSDRSSAYLASWRPVVMQDTGFGDHLPCGSGLLSFRTPEEAISALEEASGNFERHSRAARAIAEEYLDAPKVLGGLLAQIGIR